MNHDKRKAAKTEVIHVVGVAAVGSLGHEKQGNTKHPCVIMLKYYSERLPCPGVANGNEM